MARQAENGFSKFDITKSKAMRNIEDIYGVPKAQFDETTYTEVKKFLDYMSDLLPVRRTG